MNRPLKFRVWTGISMEYNVVVGKDGAFYALIDRNDSACLAPTSKYHSDTPVMQYTGLSDKNGKEIYEGDIVQIGYGEYTGAFGKVIFKFGAYMLESNGGYIFQDTHKSVIYGEVIGNIHENSELLK